MADLERMKKYASSLNVNNKNSISSQIKNRLDKKEKIEEARRSGTLTPFTDGYDFGDITKTILGTGTKVLTRVGEGAVKFGENVLDTAVQFGSSKYNPFTYLYGFDPDEIQSNAKSFITQDLTSQFKDRLGYNDILPSGRTIQEALDESSLVKPGGFVDELSYAFGNMAPSIILSGLVPTGATSTLGKIATYGAQSLPIGASSFGGAIEEAYEGGATRGQATAYGLLNAATEIGTEWITGGIPGTKSAGYLDNLVEKGLNKTITNEFTKELAKYGYRVVGEAAEEALAEIISPLIKNLTYDEGQKVDWNNVLRSAVIGGIMGGIFNLPETVQGIRQGQVLDTVVDNNFDPNNLTLTEGVDVLNNLKQTTTDPIQIKKIDNAINEINTIIDEGPTETKTFADYKQDYATQLRVKQRTLGQLESKNELLRSESEQQAITKLRNDIAELRRKSSDQAKTVRLEQPQNIKEEQLKIIQKTNPMADEYHTGIRTIDDIKTFDQVINDEESFVWGDFSKTDAQKALQSGEITVYSSKPIQQGTFVSTSKNQAMDYAGGNKIYSQTVPINDVAWINGDEGQYAKLEQVSPIKQRVEKDTTVREKPKTMSDIKDSFAAQVLREIPKTELNTSVKKTFSNEMQRLVSKGYPIEKLAEQAKNPELRNKYFDMLRSNAIAQADIYQYQSDVNGKKMGEALNNLWQPIEKANLTHEFGVYEYAKHGIARNEQMKTLFGEDVTNDMLKSFIAEQERLHPEFKKWDLDIKKWQDNLRTYMNQTGLMSAKTRELLESMYPDYVRVYRENNSNKSPFKLEERNIKVNSPIKTAKGGESAIIPLKEAMARQVIEVKNAGVRNSFGNELYKTLRGEETDIDTKQIKDNLIEQDGKFAYVFYKDGKQTAIPISQEIYDSLTPSKRYAFEDTLLAKGVQKVSKVQRGLLTQYNPLFAITNFIKDVGDAPFNSRYSASFFPNLAKAANEMRIKGDLYNLYVANGGLQNTFFDYNEGFVEPKSKLLNKIAEVNEYVEQLPRLAEFISSIQHGNTVSQAMYDAAEVTTNFARGSDLSRALSRNGFNFFNASLQGFYKQYENLRGAHGVKGYIGLLTKAVAFGITPSLLNQLLLGDDDKYNELSPIVKDSNYIIKIGDKYIKIPKGRAMSIFGSAARRVMTGEGFKDFGKFAIEQVGPTNPLENNILAPIGAIKSNKNWYGGDIVPQRLQDKPPAYQYDEGTTELAKTIGKIFNFSPMKIDYLLDQYSGVAGDIIMPMMTEEAEPNFIVSKFVVDTLKSSNNVNKMYEEIDNLTKEEYDNPSEDTTLRKKYLNSMKYYVNLYFSQIRAVQSNPDLTDKEKTEQTKILREELNNLAKTTVENSKNISTKTIKGTTYKQVGLILYKYDQKNEEYKKVSTSSKNYKNVMGAALQSNAIQQEIDAEGNVYTKIGNKYYKVNDDGTYKELTTSSAINKAKIKLGY